ncbi:MAG: hypothetical protein ACOYM3_15630 [Terrimicrobiaceae bacterium]
MKVLLKIGPNSYLLPNDTGLQSVIKAMSSAVECWDYSYRASKNYDIRAKPECMEVSVKYLPPKTKIKFTDNLYADNDEPEESEQLRLIAPTSIIIPPSEA